MVGHEIYHFCICFLLGIFGVFLLCWVVFLSPFTGRFLLDGKSLFVEQIDLSLALYVYFEFVGDYYLDFTMFGSVFCLIEQVASSSEE